MTAPTKKDAYTALVFVVTAALSLIIVSVALRASAALIGIEIHDLVGWLIPALVSIVGGGFGANEYRKRTHPDG